MLFQSIEEFNIVKLPPYRSSNSQQGIVTKADQIAFMTQFYPPPSFSKLILEEPQTSESSRTSSQKSIIYSQESDIKSYSSQQKSSSSEKDIKQYEVSQIKPSNKELINHSRKFRQISLKDYENEGSEFQYRQLLHDLSFEQKHDKSASFEQKLQNKHFDFQLSQRDHSQHSSYDHHGNENEIGRIHNERKVRLTSYKSLNDFKWDSPSDILFRKQNKIKRIVGILNKRILQTQKNIVEELKNCEKVTKTISLKEKNLQKYKQNKRRKESSKICLTQRISSNIEHISQYL